MPSALNRRRGAGIQGIHSAAVCQLVGFRIAGLTALVIIAMLTPIPIGANAESTIRVPRAQPDAPAFPAPLRKRLDAALSARGPNYEARTRHLRPDGRPLFTNRLLLEKSPYLQQHAHNPVNWYPWSPEAFSEARRLGRPVLVSIGYSTCHWCHVMEEESFDSIETAKLLNAHFIAIKVDREARPDVDAIYMNAIHAMGERGGWPLNMFVTAEGKPFFGGTYFPPQDSRGRPGFPRVLTQIAAAYADDREKIQSDADGLASQLKRKLEAHVGMQTTPLGGRQLDAVVAHYKRVADREWGGVGRGTKFPSSLPIGLLLREWRRSGDEDALALARLTLDKMAAGGIHDHLGGGFHRYSTEPRWLVPHFEKMLYDNALIAVSYLEAFQATAEPAYEHVLRDLLDYVLREMTSESGGFYSATDADSLTPEGESEEGYFFTWTRTEFELLLGAQDARVPLAWYGVVDQGPLEGRNVLHTWRDKDGVATELGLTRGVFDQKLMAARKRLLSARRLRSPPLRDDKILVAWNGLMVSALAKSGFALDEPRYVDAASRAADFILKSMLDEGRLSRVSLAGEVGGPAFLEDYAFLIAGLIDLYEAGGESRWIEAALSLQAVQDKHYRDSNGGGYYRIADDGEVLLAREKPIDDGAVPSGNSLAASNLSRLAALTGDEILGQRLALLYSAFGLDLERSAAGSARLMETVSEQAMGIREIVLVEKAGEVDSNPMLAPLRTIFAPNRVVIRAREGAPLDSLAKILPIVDGKSAIGGETTAYVCLNRVCQYPTNDPVRFREQLEALPASGSPKAP
jgi:uncharacterized protein YyaL (SSP411 family)